MANKVDTKHKLYPSLELKRDVFRAVKGGTDTIQSFKTTYLPKFPAEDSTEYNARLTASTIDGIVMGGVDTLTGSVFFGDIDTSAVNPAIVPLLDNIDNKGNSFEVFARCAFECAFEGVSVIVIDRPKVPEGVPIVSLEDQKTLDIRTYWRMYTAHDVINWRYRVNPISKATELELIVLSEPVEVVDPKDRFSVTTIQKYRVYFLNGNVVNWELWKRADGVQSETFIREDFGSLPEYSAIPVSFVGCLDDDPRLLVESRLEVKAYQKESSYDVIEYLSVPTFCTKGYDGTEPLKLGAATHLKLPVDGDAFYMQIDQAGHMSLKDTIAIIKDFIKGRLSELTTSATSQAAQPKTATQTIVEDKDKQARLIVWAEQFKDALELALGFTAESMGMDKTEGGELVLNTKWAASQAAAEQMRANLAGQPNDPNMPKGNMPPASTMMN